MGNAPKAVPFEPSHDIYHYTGNPLDKIFAPKSVALIGATEASHSCRCASIGTAAAARSLTNVVRIL